MDLKSKSDLLYNFIKSDLLKHYVNMLYTFRMLFPYYVGNVDSYVNLK